MNKMYCFLLGFCSMTIIAMIVLSCNPAPETKVVCLSCGAEKWWMVLAEGEEEYDSNN